MNHEAALKLQAWLDGELPPAAAGEVARWVQRDPVAGALVTELRHTRTALREGEPDRCVPVHRSFYWSGIERAIAHAHPARTEPSPVSPFAWLSRFLAPLGIVAALAVLLAVPLLRDGPGRAGPWVSEIESPLDDIGSVTFRSESEGVTVVWVTTR